MESVKVCTNEIYCIKQKLTCEPSELVNFFDQRDKWIKIVQAFSMV